MTAPERIVEVKRHLDGREQRFETELVHREPSLLVVLYRLPDGPQGALDSYGCYWPRRRYVCYHMVRPPGSERAGEEVVTRFDVARDVELLDGEVRFTDLLLDLWVEGGYTYWQDADEVEAALASGVLSAEDAAYIEAARQTLDRDHRRVVREVRALLVRLGRIEDG